MAIKTHSLLRIFLSSPNETRDLGLVQMVERGGNNNTGEGVKGKKARTVSDDVGGKSVSEKSRSTGGKCVDENSTGVKPGPTRTSNNPFEVSRSENP